MSKNVKIIITEIGDREQYCISVEFGDDRLILSYAPNLDDALEYVSYLLRQKYNLKFELDQETGSTLKVKEDSKKIQDYIDYVKSTRETPNIVPRGEFREVD